MLFGLRGSTLPQGRPTVPGGPGGAGVRSVIVSALKQQPGELRDEPLPQRLESKYEPCEPSTSSLADFGARVTLERLYSWNALDDALGGMPHGAFFVTVDDRPQRTRNQGRSEDYFANVGDAIRCLREDIPMLFQRELNFDIYRDDVVFRDPRNCFKGMKNYQLIFWSLRFHGKIFFKTLYVDVRRIWQPEDGIIKMRWTVHGIPRVPWEAEGTFDGISTYRLDSHGKIYEHSVDNILLRDPPMATNPPLLAGLNLQPLAPQQPVPGAWCKGAELAQERWGAYGYVQRMVASALRQLEQLETQEPEPAAAMAGLPASTPAPGAHAAAAAHGVYGRPCAANSSSAAAVASAASTCILWGSSESGSGGITGGNSDGSGAAGRDDGRLWQNSIWS
ncbi:hypothetical protein VOLCADRAFT_77161 [Volvox carteri f. nagariensis]|uniref:Uncharacterized protein n=1 Tax=Volvox carteri f. nagariensis TaxID=3068 RepID=D8UD57_VOLCA|nr:uncharacterized protein VOLCADRAFT_77161 [Volvox carteri f. nagariensis]EFJ42374.1 hypothetical protein VOLCADRAFT_77161 [Volvox carteri f. nagariensis]|eukprot:XP_002956607.1 hypothetical protein VOLCADRAFT_77161 [Volvox carteri f. nagariensis]